jgi:hypothetical protein
MEDNSYSYYNLGNEWKDNPAYKCCMEDPGEIPPGCDCCYDTWVKELKEVSLEYKQVSEQAAQINEKYKFIVEERDKFKVWVSDLEKANDLARAVCDQFQVIGSQSGKICINSHKTIKAIEILFCMIRDLFEQLDLLLTIYNQIDNCIKCLNSEELPEGSGIRKCLSDYQKALDSVLKTRTELVKAIMKVIRDAYLLHDGICYETGTVEIINEWLDIMNCSENCGTKTTPVDPCSDEASGGGSSGAHCRLKPILTLPICNDGYYLWVKGKYEEDFRAASEEAKKLVEINKRKEAIAACQDSLTKAINEVNPRELCK